MRQTESVALKSLWFRSFVASALLASSVAAADHCPERPDINQSLRRLERLLERGDEGSRFKALNLVRALRHGPAECTPQPPPVMVMPPPDDFHAMFLRQRDDWAKVQFMREHSRNRRFSTDQVAQMLNAMNDDFWKYSLVNELRGQVVDPENRYRIGLVFRDTFWANRAVDALS